MAQQHAIELALDLARMPALARTSVAPALPPNIVDLMRIAAGSPESCQAAVAKTGETAPVVIEAARFYLQHALFRPEADCYRILGIEPGASRATARTHLRWLLEWLHPDRNNNSWDAVYAERVLKAWREVSASNASTAQPSDFRAPASSNKKGKGNIKTIWVPWIEHPVKSRAQALRSYHALAAWTVPTVLVIIFLALWSTGMLLLR
jgi:hypothetical protein